MRLLERLGMQPVAPPQQTCCGQMHINTGYLREAAPLIQRYVSAFEDCDAVVAPSASCVSTIRHFHERITASGGHPDRSAAVAALAARTYELTEFLVDVVQTTDVGAYYPHRVTYHPTCHSLRHLAVGSRPTRLLQAVDGLTLVDLPAAEECCGFGGTFALKNADVSVAIGADKVRRVLQTEAAVLTAVDNSCLMQISGLMTRQHAGVRVVHLAEILASTKETPL
ncbi:hypothetical protein STVIR_0775 [Streptomyces viridochromogenes Tue57]|uniref:Cysteine-rich domain-containing protein n=1 Tax=Streptomyces viridochromogenes Tue57 TaxID=1160705 RepID=L8PQ47_STRVR|nr:hypothetical protein STVIR_0775 [Streptomyces viridochromogenes Tue57]